MKLPLIVSNCQHVNVTLFVVFRRICSTNTVAAKRFSVYVEGGGLKISRKTVVWRPKTSVSDSEGSYYSALRIIWPNLEQIIFILFREKNGRLCEL